MVINVFSRRVAGWPAQAPQDDFASIEMFYDPKRKPTNNGMLLPVDFEIRQQKLHDAGV